MHKIDNLPLQCSSHISAPLASFFLLRFCMPEFSRFWPSLLRLFPWLSFEHYFPPLVVGACLPSSVASGRPRVSTSQLCRSKLGNFRSAVVLVFLLQVRRCVCEAMPHPLLVEKQSYFKAKWSESWIPYNVKSFKRQLDQKSTCMYKKSKLWENPYSKKYTCKMRKP